MAIGISVSPGIIAGSKCNFNAFDTGVFIIFYEKILFNNTSELILIFFFKLILHSKKFNYLYVQLTTTLIAFFAEFFKAIGWRIGGCNEPPIPKLIIPELPPQWRPAPLLTSTSTATTRISAVLFTLNLQHSSIYIKMCIFYNNIIYSIFYVPT